jgi:alpha-beta hydrolase superfamily lysophospholipase
MTNQPDTVVLIHGLWMTALSWEHWADRYRQAGMNVVAESWPGMDVGIDQLRSDTSKIDDLGVTEVADHYEEIIRGLDAPPIIMGHSFGGAITQILLDRGVGAAGVAIDSAPIKGVLALPVSSLRSGFPALKNPKNDHRAVTLTPEEFHYAFTNTLSDEESLEVYNRYAVPGPGRVLFQAAFANFNPKAATKVDFHNDDRAPLLIVAGGEDHVSPVAINKSEAHHQEKSAAITAYKEFPGRSHYTLGQEGWEEVADYALAWALDPIAIPV